MHYNRITGIPHRLAGYFALVTQTATSPQRKPLLDEASFQQLLSAAHVLQEHNDRLRAKGSQADFAENLSAIVETQKLIQTLQLDLAAASELVAERIQKVTNASGTAIGILEKGELFYRTATGSAAIDAGTRLAPASALSGDCLSKGSALNYPDVTSSLHVRADLFRSRNVKAFIAVPVYHAGQVAGVLELRFAQPNSFREADLRTAELMAGLLSEAMVTAARMKWKEALASERQSMLEALERIKPQIERLGNDSLSLADVGTASPTSIGERAVARREPPAQLAAQCAACGADFFDESESFCGTCGAARPIAPPLLVPRPEVSTKLDTPSWLIPYGQENPTHGIATEPLPAQSGITAPIPGIRLRAAGPAEHGRHPGRTGCEARIAERARDSDRACQPSDSAFIAISAAASRGPRLAAHRPRGSSSGRPACAAGQARALSLGLGQESAAVAGDGKDPSGSARRMAGATVAKAAGKYLPGDGGRHPAAGDLRMGHPPGRDDRRGQCVPGTERPAANAASTAVDVV